MKKIEYDQADLKIIKSFREKGREKFSLHVKKLNMPKSTLHDRIKKIKRTGARFTAIMRWEAVGCPFMVCFFTEYDEDLLDHPNVNNCQKVAPDIMFIECVFPTASQVEDFKEKYAVIKAYPVIDLIKKEAFIPTI